MAITTSGGSGSVAPALSANTNATVLVFTTPNIANALFFVTVFLAGSNTSMGGDAADGHVHTSYGDDGYNRVSARKIKVGPNTPVYVAIRAGSSPTCTLVYDYLSVVFS